MEGFIHADGVVCVCIVGGWVGGYRWDGGDDEPSREKPAEQTISEKNPICLPIMKALWRDRGTT